MFTAIRDIGKLNQKAREAWLERTLRSIPAGTRILDAGSGEQQYKKWCAHLDYVAQDFARYDGRGDARGLQTGSWEQTKLDIVSDITAIPKPDASFGAIMCIEVLEHLPEPIKAIKELSRLLKPGGQLILSAPFCSLTHFAPYHFYTGFSSYFYQTHLVANGLEIVDIHPNGNYFTYLAQEIYRIPFMAGQYAGKRIGLWQRCFIGLLLVYLNYLSRRDKGSNEMLNFGFHLRAVKKG